MSLVSWKLENGLCRCCHNDGTHRNLGEPCLQQGRQEIFVDMLQKCLNISLSPMPGPLCTVTYTICEDCIQRLQDACNFKQQVIECEQRFHELYDQNIIKLASDCSINVKQENPDDDDDDVKPDLCLNNADDGYDYSHNGSDDNFDTDLDIKQEQTKKSQSKKAKTKEKAKAKPKSHHRKQNAKPKPDSQKEKKGDATQRPFVTLEDGDRKRCQCTICHKVYNSRDLFSQHYKHVHLKLRPKLRSCYLCPVKVATHLRAKHLEEAHGIPRPECNACGKKFSYPNQVLRHQKAFHMDEKMFPCPHCDLKCATRWQLTRHANKHSPKRPYHCEYCDKTFKWKKNLKTHIMIHVDERPHICPICQEAFVQQSSLKYHLTKKHAEFH